MPEPGIFRVNRLKTLKNPRLFRAGSVKQEAAELLNVSRPFLVKLLEQGAMPYTMVGTHRRIRFEDLTAYKEQRDNQRRESLKRLTQLSEEMGLYDVRLFTR